MNRDDIRAAISQAEANQGAGCLMQMEMFIIAVVLGLRTESWWVFGGIFLGTYIVMASKILGRILCLALSLGWGVVGYALGTPFSSSSAGIVLGIIGLFFGLGVHFGALEWYNDMS